LTGTSAEFEEKLCESRRLVTKALETHRNPVVACSFGKNSMAVLHLVRQVNPEVPVLFNNTLVEFPDTYKFKKKMVRDWALRVIETRPTRDFWWVVEQYGFPLYSRKGHKDASKNCCRYLKEYPIERVLRREKFDLYFTGLTRYESWRREWAARKHGSYFFSKRFSYWRCHPIQNWTDQDVWEYHRIYSLPHNGVYDKEPVNGYDLRTGCWCCTIPIRYGKIEFLRKNYPHLWKKLIKKGLGSVIIEKKIGQGATSEMVDQWMDARPCFFDKI
jgi:3'-phosphoadenosine 5'-phosphosulfate sulfotransferase (PAPS reductase)/FAD synthetase